jgi:hypothetical protein
LHLISASSNRSAAEAARAVDQLRAWLISRSASRL